MRLSQHPEYTQYLQDRETVQRCRRAVAAWQADGEPVSAAQYGISWTHERASAFVRSLVRMFLAYNRVLWERFPYCRACGGGCCVLDASRVGPFDGIALALLDLPLPTLSEGNAVRERACIYLASQQGAWPAGWQCALPAQWRTVKCWSFYCLGGRWDPGLSLGEHHGALAGALKGVILDLLPEELRRYEHVCGDPLIAHLDDPTDFAHALDDALFEILVAPLHERYPVLDGAQADGLGETDSGRSVEEDVLAFVAQAAEQLYDSWPADFMRGPVSPDQLLADLELLEWIVVGRPANQDQLLGEMSARYAGMSAPQRGAQPAIWHRMRECISMIPSTRPTKRS